jgi:hypothetical protein
LRILWLKPHEFCAFETMYKNWNKWLAGNSNCNNDFNTCDMFNLVMHQPFECPGECEDCEPCKEPGNEEKVNCATEAIANEPQFVFLNQVNDTFCLPRYCKEYEQGETYKTIHLKERTKTLPAKEPAKKTMVVPVAEVVAEKKLPVAVVKQPENNTTTPAPEAIPAKQPVPETAKKTEKKVIPESENKQNTIQLKAKVVNARFNKYRNVATNVLEHSKSNPIVAKLQSFLAAGTPNADALDKIVTEIIQNLKPAFKGAKILNQKQQLNLLEAAVCHYLDKVCFNGKDETRITALQKIATRMIKARIDMQSIYNYWDAAEVEKYEPGTDTDFIRHIITGKK